MKAKIILVVSSLLACLLVFIAVDLSFRIITKARPGWPADQFGLRYDFVLSPYLMFSEPDIHEGGNLNKQGFAGKELSPQKSPNEVRIAIIGGSAVWNGGNKNSIAINLERFLQKSFPDKVIKVINYGRQSYLSAQELILLQRKILPLSFDLVIVYDGYNDFWVPYQAEPLGVGYPYLYSNLKKRVDQSANLINFTCLANFFCRHSAIFNYFVVKSGKQAQLKIKGGFRLEECVQEYKRNLSQMEKLSEAYNTRVIFAPQPFVVVRNPPRGRENKFLDAGEFKLMQKCYMEIIEASKEVADKNKAEYIPIWDTFDSLNQEIFIDIVHIDLLSGNPLVAKRLADEIISRGIIGGKP